MSLGSRERAALEHWQESQSIEAQGGHSCQCENRIHFEQPNTPATTIHRYFAVVPKVTTIRTPSGPYNLCDDCLKDMHVQG